MASGLERFGFRVSGFRVSGFRVSGFKVSGFTVSGFRVSGFEVSGFRVSGFRVSGFKVSGFRVSGFRVWGSGCLGCRISRVWGFGGCSACGGVWETSLHGRCIPLRSWQGSHKSRHIAVLNSVPAETFTAAKQASLYPEGSPVSPWCLGGNGGMEPYSSPYNIFSNNIPYNPFPHSLRREGSASRVSGPSTRNVCGYVLDYHLDPT